MFSQDKIFSKRFLHISKVFLNITEKIQRILLPLIVFLIPSQLSYHIWPEWSYVFGLRVDYLSVSVYLIEVLVFLLLVLWFLEVFLRRVGGASKETFIFKRKGEFLFLSFFIFSLINIFNSISVYASMVSWVKFYLLFFLALYLIKLRNFDLKKWFIVPLSYSLIFFAVLGIFQFIEGSSLGGMFYFLGERSFSVNSPGIALTNFFGREFLRPYSTFPHPNAFSGFYLISILFLAAVLEKRGSVFDRLRSFFVFASSFLVFILTFSKSVFLSMIEILFLGAYLKFIKTFTKIFAKTPVKVSSKKIRNNFFSLRFLNYMIVFFFLISLVSLFLSGRVRGLGFNILNGRVPFDGLLNERSFTERVDLLIMTGNLLKDNYLFGVGKNAFIKGSPSVYCGNSISWILQPVHNVFLLSFAELGVFGFLMFFIFLGVLARKIYETKNIILVFLFVAFLTTLSLDHYWYTLEQNQLLLAVIFGILFNEEYLLEFKRR